MRERKKKRRDEVADPIFKMVSNQSRSHLFHSIPLYFCWFLPSCICSFVRCVRFVKLNEWQKTGDKWEDAVYFCSVDIVGSIAKRMAKSNVSVFICNVPANGANERCFFCQSAHNTFAQKHTLTHTQAHIHMHTRTRTRRTSDRMCMNKLWCASFGNGS